MGRLCVGRYKRERECILEMEHIIVDINIDLVLLYAPITQMH